MAFKMKGHSLPGPNQRKSPATHTFSDEESKGQAKLLQHNKKHREANADTPRSSHFRKKDVTTGEEGSPADSKSPAKIAPLVLMAGKALLSKAMEKKENDSPVDSKSPAKAEGDEKKSVFKPIETSPGVWETRDKDSITRTEKSTGKTSTWKQTSVKDNKDGSKTYTFTNEKGNVRTETHK